MKEATSDPRERGRLPAALLQRVRESRLKHVDPIFHGDVRQAAFKALELH